MDKGGGFAAEPQKRDTDKILEDIVVYAEVWSDRDNRSECVRRELEQLGAIVVKKFTKDVTHVVFKEGNVATVKKAQKKGIHLVSLLWVENCKVHQERVPEKMYPANLPDMGTPLFMKKIRRQKAMQPVDFEEELANSMERLKKKRKKACTAESKLISNDNTPISTARSIVLVQDTQPRSPEEDYVLTPVRLRIPDTPPSMREKMKQMKLAREARLGSYTNSVEENIDLDEKLNGMKPLQRHLFESADESPDEATDVSVDNELHNLVQDINSTLNDKNMSSPSSFSGSQNQLNSQEINSVITSEIQFTNIRTKPTAFNINDKPDNLDANAAIKKDEPEESKSDILDLLVDKVSPVIEKIENKKPRRRSARRMSVKEAMRELDNSVLTAEAHELDSVKTDSELHESPGTSSGVKLDNEDDSERRIISDVSKVPVKKGRRSVAGNLDKIKQDDVKEKVKKNSRGRRSSFVNVKVNEQSDNQKNNKKAENEHENNETKEETLQPTQRTMKKKLMSLTDLTDQHSVLIEPTKCSKVERTELNPQKQKMGRKKVVSASDLHKTGRNINRKEHDSSTTNENDVQDNLMDGVESQNQENNRGTRKNKKGRGKNSAQTDELEPAKKTRRKNDIDKSPEHNRKAKTSHALVNETVTEEDKIHGSQPISSCQTDLTTQLNLTKDSSSVCSLRETSLSLSMSRAYNDVSSILHSSRKSVDEFNISQRKSRKRAAKKRPLLTTVDENSSKYSLSKSESSISGKKVGLNSSGSRKMVRPSLVMTSLHSCEQDIVISVVKKLGGFVISNNVNETTSHVICGEPRRTLNLLQCLARGVWLLSKEWVLKSLEAGHWIPEEEFEMDSFFPACKLARLEREEAVGIYRQAVFTDVGPIYISGRASPPRQDLVQLVVLCGGQVTGVREKAAVYVGSDYHPDLTCVSTKWLLECVTMHEAVPMEGFYLDRPKKENSPVY